MEVFDGKKVSREIISILQKKVAKNKVHAKLVSILVGDDKASELYSKIKQETAEKMGFEMETKKFPKKTNINKLIQLIEGLNIDDSVDGIMIQLPLPDSLKEETGILIDQIGFQKDVDGMKENSPFLSATIKAVEKIISYTHISQNSRIAVVGAKGEMGKRVLQMLRSRGYKNITSIDIKDSLGKLKDADVIISATGKANIIKSKCIKNNVVLIDVGAPKPEFEKTCYTKARFYTPVPGGVGPMTVACLMENLYEAARR